MISTMLQPIGNPFYDTTLKLVEIWWMSILNVLMPAKLSHREPQTTVIVMPVFLNISNPY